MSLRIIRHSYCFALLLILPSLAVFAQDPSQSVVVSPSPSSASAARYSEVPIDLSTGVPQISLPLYVIQSSKLSYPISMSYHASGIKVNDVAGPLGTGWTLTAGGLINRIMRNRPDEQANGFFSNASAIPDDTDPLTFLEKENLANRTNDMMPDLFYYSTGMSAGKIMFDNQLAPRTIPNNSLKITTQTATLSTFTFSDPSGTNYEFEAGETATAAIPMAGPVSYISSWYLSRIVSADKQDTIRFNYELESEYTYTTSENTGLNYFYNAPAGAARALHEMNAINSNIPITVTGTRYLSSIEYKGGKVSFSFSTGRTDDENGRKLDQIIVYVKDPVWGNYVENKQINFDYSYFDNSDSGKRLRLDRMYERINGNDSPPYTFAYTTKQLPAPGSTAQDHWGYYNGAIANTNLIPAYSQAGFVVSTNNREVDPNYADGCIIKSITSPLSGITEFQFESNDYWSGIANTSGPGLRISKIIKKDPFTAINAITNYEYTNPDTGNSSGSLMNSPNYFTDLAVVDNSHGNWYYYNCLLIKLNATSVGNFSGAPLTYEYVTVYTNDDENSTGKTVSKFTTYTVPDITFPYFPVDDNSWTAGDLLTQKVYKVENDNSTLVKKIVNTYDLSPYAYTIKGLSVAVNKIFFFTDPGVNDFVLKNFYTYSKFPFLKETKVYSYEDDGSTSSLVTNSFYHDNTDTHLFLTKAETTTSSSTDKIKKEYTYVADYPSSGVIGVMKSLNMTGLPIDVTTSLVKSGTDYITDYQKTEYYEWKPNRVYPKNFYGAEIPLNTLKSTFTAAPGNYEKLTSTINAYSPTGVPLESQANWDVPRSIITDNRVHRIVASADQSSADQIAYSGFESNDHGNWKIAAGNTTTSKDVSLTLSHTFETIVLSSNQTINYTYSVTKSNGPSPVMVFTKGATTINAALTNATGIGSSNLTTGTWNVSLVYDFNVTAITSNFSYDVTTDNIPTIVDTEYKTGRHSLKLGAAQTISRDSLPAGNYVAVYYEKGGTVTLSTSGGATVVTTLTGATEADGWTKVQKEISISALSQTISITGTTSMYIDELRLYPVGAFMNTSNYDAFKNQITKTDVNLRSQSIEYDTRRRILLIRDHEKNILKHYDYQFAID